MVGDNAEVSNPATLHTIDEETPGIVVARARSENEALDLMARTHPDVVCVDDSNGLELTHRLKRHDPAPSVVLIMPEDEHRTAAVESSRADGTVRKERWESELPQVLGTLANA
jgi:DNA-binding NarL/FixJ family response regulator